MNEWPFTSPPPRVTAPWLALDGFPVSGDELRKVYYITPAAQSFRMPELLWAAVCK